MPSHLIGMNTIHVELKDIIKPTSYVKEISDTNDGERRHALNLLLQYVFVREPTIIPVWAGRISI